MERMSSEDAYMFPIVRRLVFPQLYAPAEKRCRLAPRSSSVYTWL